VLLCLCILCDRHLPAAAMHLDRCSARCACPITSPCAYACRCYLRLADNPRAKEALRSYLPQSLITAQLPFRPLAEKDPQVMSLLQQLRQTVGIDDNAGGVRVDGMGGGAGTAQQRQLGAPPPPSFAAMSSQQPNMGNMAAPRRR
jgi:CCR4-NOT transcription complex subunit 9